MMFLLGYMLCKPNFLWSIFAISLYNVVFALAENKSSNGDEVANEDLSLLRELQR